MTSLAKKSEILKREARILRGHYGEAWKEVIEKVAKDNDVDIGCARRIAMLRIFEPLLGYSIKDLKIDAEDSGQTRVLP